MNHTCALPVVLTIILAGPVAVSGQQSPVVPGAASADLSPGVPAIIKMHQSGVPGDMIVKAVEAAASRPTLTPIDNLALKGAGVPDEVIRAIAGQPQTGDMSRPWEPGTVDLLSVRRIYIKEMPEELDQHIRAEITKKFKGSILVVLAPEDADAVMVGTADSRSGVGAAITGRWLGLHDNATGAVSLVDKAGKVVLWSSEAGDRSLWCGALKRGGLAKVADRLMSDLKKSMGR